MSRTCVYSVRARLAATNHRRHLVEAPAAEPVLAVERPERQRHQERCQRPLR